MYKKTARETMRVAYSIVGETMRVVYSIVGETMRVVHSIAEETHEQLVHKYIQN